jgi:two-component system, NarL family, sensor histidine kinase UhpB
MQQARQPMDLPRLVMRRALAVAVGCLALSVLPGLVRVGEDTRQEMEGSLALARISRELSQLETRDSAAALDSLRAMQGMRHLQLDLWDADGQGLLRLADEGTSAKLHGAWPGLSQFLGVTPMAQSVSCPCLVRMAGRGPWL